MRLLLRLALLLALAATCGMFGWSQTSSPRPDYGYWLNEDVLWIITPVEREVFLMLQGDQERDKFISQFWARRDPTPDTLENEFKEEHYRRMAYANEQFPTGVTPGWKSDRGRICVAYGQPDKVESVPSDNGTAKFPVERWHYRYLEGIGQDLILEFIDTCRCGDYRLTLDQASKDVPLLQPVRVLPPVTGNRDELQGMMRAMLRGQAPPPPKFKDLQELLAHKINRNVLPLELHADFLKITSFSDLVPITIGVKYSDLKFVDKDGVASATVNIFGMVTTPAGYIVAEFEGTVKAQMPAQLLPSKLQDELVYWKALPLAQGPYRLAVAVNDVAGDRVGTAYRGLAAPAFREGRLAMSSLMLGRQMSSATQMTQVLGTTNLRPMTKSIFQRDDQLNLWMQVYGLGIDAGTQRPSATVEYDIANAAGKSFLHVADEPQQFGRQMTLKKTVPLGGLAPGRYQVTIKVSDKIMQQSASQVSAFVVQ